MTPIIQVNNLQKSYADLRAVDGVSFDVMKGQCFGLLGPNGAGKTTTIEMLEGLVTPDSGEINYYSRLTGPWVLDKIGIQFQHTALQDYLNCTESIDLFRALYPNPLDTDVLISMCQLTEFAKQQHKTLSGGQRQRLLLALAMVNDPDILFLDEPTTGLDPQARRHFWQLINHIKQQGKTILMTTHYMDEAEQLCDEIIVMDRGKVIESGSPKMLLQHHFPGVLIRLSVQKIPESLAEQYQIKQVGNYLEFSVSNVEESLRQLVKSNVVLEGMQVKAASLDDLFLKLTGHDLGGNDV